jgi:hypothetical protein
MTMSGERSRQQHRQAQTLLALVFGQRAVKLSYSAMAIGAGVFISVDRDHHHVEGRKAGRHHAANPVTIRKKRSLRQRECEHSADFMATRAEESNCIVSPWGQIIRPARQ